ncbi:hypothetical protein BC628DRAFT_557574 [Trametes gibbosa]|nr:hypothetical protein BC628DRAFT_557574 [Trametes gibbosa]
MWREAVIMHGGTAQGYTLLPATTQVTLPTVVPPTRFILRLVRETTAKMSKKSRPARRLFGRPPDGPGPQQTFSSTFQVSPAPEPARQDQFRLDAGSHPRGPSHHLLNTLAEAARDDRHESAGASTSAQRPSLSILNASPNASDNRSRMGEFTAGVLPRRRRPSNAAHRTTQSTPVVSTTQAAGAKFSRSRSSTAVASDILSGLNDDSAGPSSLPTRLRELSLPATSDYRGTSQSALGTSGQYSPYGATSSFHTPSSGSGVSASHRRLPSYDLPVSPSDSSPWAASPSPVPHTPSSLRGTSIPRSLASEASPYLGLMIGDFSPELAPTDGEEVPPLTPDHAAAMELPRIWRRQRSHSSAQVIRSQHGGIFMSAEATQSSISVPEELRGLQFPPEVFGLDGPSYVGPDTPDGELSHLPGLHGLSPPRPPQSSRAVSRRPPGI